MRAMEIEKQIRQIQADTTRDQRARDETIDKLLENYLAEVGPDERSSSIDLLREIAEQSGIPVTLRRPPEVPTKPSPAALAASRREPSWTPGEGHFPPREAEPSPVSGPKILVIDDDKDVRETLANVLGDEGYRIYQARDGEQGLARLVQMPRVDLILLDLLMPNVSGFEFLEAIDRSPYSEVPILIISAQRPDPDELDRYLSDARVFMGKPLELEPLISTVRAHVDQSRRRRA
jgi:CheY-like chemotaxis protein